MHLYYALFRFSAIFSLQMKAALDWMISCDYGVQARGNPGEEFPRRAPASLHRHNRYSTELPAGKEAWTRHEVNPLRRGISLCDSFVYLVIVSCLQCFDTVGWLGVRKSIWPVKIKWWGVDVVICLERGADCLHMVQLMSLHPNTSSSLASFKSRLVLPFWYWLTQS